MKTFDQLSKEDIAGILNTAMNNGEWHTPSARDIEIVQQSTVVAYGKFKCSLHNTFWDQERWFNINADTIQIWMEEPREGRANKCLYTPIHNLISLAKVLEKFQPSDRGV